MAAGRLLLNKPKTRPAAASVASLIRSLPDERARSESRTLVKLLTEVTNSPPRLWGTSIVGFGRHTYRGASGRGGDWPLVGFAPRKDARVLYILSGLARHKRLLARLGTFRAGKGCLYIRSLEDVDLDVLRTLCADSVRLVGMSA